MSIVSNGSVIFKYLPGQETPPAEYALPVSILKVYGEDLALVEDEIDQHLNNGGGIGVDRSSGSARDNNIMAVRRKVFVDEENPRQIEDATSNSNNNIQSSVISSLHHPTAGTIISHPLPPMPIHVETTNTATATATSVVAGATLLLPEQQQQQPQQQQRILPYHERKRLSELLDEKEKQRRKNKYATTTSTSTTTTTTNPRYNSQQGLMRGSTSEKSPLNGVRSDGYGGTTTAATTTSTTLLASRGDNTNINCDVEEGGVGVGHDNVVKPQPPKDTTKEWFGQLVAIITGKKSTDNNATDADGSGDNDATTRKRLPSDPKQSYRDKAEAFLKKTEVERMKIKELSSLVSVLSKQQSL